MLHFCSVIISRALVYTMIYFRAQFGIENEFASQTVTAWQLILNHIVDHDYASLRQTVPAATVFKVCNKRIIARISFLRELDGKIRKKQTRNNLRGKKIGEISAVLGMLLRRGHDVHAKTINCWFFRKYLTNWGMIYRNRRRRRPTLRWIFSPTTMFQA